MHHTTETRHFRAVEFDGGYFLAECAEGGDLLRTYCASSTPAACLEFVGWLDGSDSDFAEPVIYVNAYEAQRLPSSPVETWSREEDETDREFADRVREDFQGNWRL